jgi:hypothetical protein
MKSMIVPLAATAMLALGTALAWAASPAYCELYANEFVQLAAQSGTARIAPEHIRERAYHICLNTDDEPVVPTYYADPMIGGIGGPFATNGEDSADRTATPTVAAAVGQSEGEKRAAGSAPGEDLAALAPEPQPPEKEVSTTPATPVARLVSRVWNLKDPKAPSASASVLGGSGLPMWTPEWEDWCKDRFPNTFDPKSGTVSIDHGPRIKC